MRWGTACALFLALTNVNVAAQIETVRCGQAGGGTIRGVVVADSSETPVVAHGVRLLDTACAAVTDADGAFVLSGVPPGSYSLDADPIGGASVDPIPVDVTAAAAIELRLVLRVDDEIRACRREAGCAPLLEPDPGLSLSVTDGLTEIVWRTAVVLAGARIPEHDWVACVPPLPAVVRAALEDRFAPVADEAECALGQPDRDAMPPVVHTPSGDPARLIKADLRYGSTTRAVVDVRVSTAALDVSQWSCTFERPAGAWVTRWCVGR